MAKTEVIIIRVTPEQKRKIKAVANRLYNGNMSRFILAAIKEIK